MRTIKSTAAILVVASLLACKTSGPNSTSLKAADDVPPSPCSFADRLGDDLERAIPATNYYNLSWDVFLSMARASMLAYEAPTAIQATARKWGFRTIDVVQEAGLLAFVASNERCIIVSFRGTDEIRDWLTNGQLVGKQLRFGRLHSGFYDGYARIKNRIAMYLRAQRGREKTVWVTGHSLGGALASVLAYENSLLAPEQREAEFEYVVTFGQPLLADAPMAKYLGQEYRFRFFRIVNDGDIVARIPPGYTHFGSLVWFQNDQLVFRPELSREYVGTYGAGDPGDAGVRAEAVEVNDEPLSQEDFAAFMRGEAPPPLMTTQPEGGGDVQPYGAPPPVGALSVDDHSIHHYIDLIRHQLGLR